MNYVVKSRNLVMQSSKSRIDVHMRGGVTGVVEMTIFPKTKTVQEEKWSVTSVIEMVTLQNSAKLNRNM